MPHKDGNGGGTRDGSVDLLKVLAALTRALSSLTGSVEALEVSNDDLRRRVADLEERRKE